LEGQRESTVTPSVTGKPGTLRALFWLMFKRAVGIEGVKEGKYAKRNREQTVSLEEGRYSNSKGGVR
jgi:hypothetical protein